MLAEAAPDALLLVDADGVIRQVNAQAARTFGYERDELVGSSVDLLVPEHARVAHHDHRLHFGRHPSLRPMGASQRLTARRRGGDTIPVEISLSPVEVGGESMVAVAVRDVTGRRHEEERLRALLDAAPDATLIVDTAGTIVVANRQVEAVFGYERTALVGQKIEVLVPERLREDHRSHRADFASAPGVRPMGNGTELHAVRRDGTEFPVEISLSPITTRRGTLISAAVRDISERKRLEARATRLREELIATVSHELRTPLTSILGYVEMLHEMGASDVSRDARRLLGVVERNAQRELTLVSDLLTMVALGGEQFDLSLRPTSLESVARTCLEAVQARAEEAGLTLKLVVDDIPPVSADAVRLGQVIDNLLSNAVKFTPRGGLIDVEVRDDGEWALLEVIDNGIGMTHEESGQVFERLYRAPGVIASQVQGAGLGLSIAQSIVEAHGGTIEVESVPDEGSVFRVRLPWAATP